jgi:hypothetical protein
MKLFKFLEIFFWCAMARKIIVIGFPRQALQGNVIIFRTNSLVIKGK